MNKQEYKNTKWQMRTDPTDRKRIAALAKRLGMNESEAVRRAVVYLLANQPKTAQTR